MKIGVPKETKVRENRVAVTPENAKKIVEAGHTLYVESNAGIGIGEPDEHYTDAGAAIVSSVDMVHELSDMIVKVKEPSMDEARLIRDGQLYCAYLHLACSKEVTDYLLERRLSSISWEAISIAYSPHRKHYPMLEPMSIVAGRMATQIGAHYLEHPSGGRGILLGGAPGVQPARVVIIGAGNVGKAAAEIALGMGAFVVMLDKSETALIQAERELKAYNKTFVSCVSTPELIHTHVVDADLVVGAVYVFGALAPKLVKEDTVKQMKKGSVIVDVAIDQGGCFETSLPTTHENPIYYRHGVLHYCVPNMPGAVPHTSAYAFSNASMPYIMTLASKGFEQAVRDDPGLLDGVATYDGQLFNSGVADTFGYPVGDRDKMFSYWTTFPC